MPAARQLIKHVLAAALPRRRFLLRGPADATQPPRIALTFDDGPHDEHTPALLDRLAELGIRGTFFVVGARAARCPWLVRRIRAEGHQLGNHTWTHCEPRRATAAAFLAEIDRTQRWLEDLTGAPCRLVRPPHGRLTPRTLWGLLARRLTVALWNVDPRDWQITSSDELRRWCDAYRPRGGDIVLLHDNRPHAVTVMEQFVQMDVEFTTLGRWVRATNSVSIEGAER